MASSISTSTKEVLFGKVSEILSAFLVYFEGATETKAQLTAREMCMNEMTEHIEKQRETENRATTGVQPTRIANKTATIDGRQVCVFCDAVCRRGANAPPPGTVRCCWLYDTALKNVIDGNHDWYGANRSTTGFAVRVRRRVNAQLLPGEQQPTTWTDPPWARGHLTGRQKRLACYYRIFKELFGIGVRGHIEVLPLCIVSYVRQKYPRKYPDNGLDGQRDKADE
jgi:hypothetical protein